MFGAIGDAIGGAIGGIGDAIGGAVGGIADAFGGEGGLFGGALGGIADMFDEVAGVIGDVADTIADNPIANAFQSIMDIPVLGQMIGAAFPPAMAIDTALGFVDTIGDVADKVDGYTDPFQG